MQLEAQRMRRYEKPGKFYQQNAIFKNITKEFYREIGKEKVTVNETRAINDIERFWDTIWSEEKDFNQRVEWIKNVQTDYANIQEQQCSDISVEELQTALKKSHKWKSAGTDQVLNYCFNSLHKGHYILTSLFSDTIKNLEDSPAWLSEGITYLLPKTNDRVNPKNCRPITCLSTTYKLLTLTITERMYVFMGTNDLLFPVEQKSCRRRLYGCKDQLLIN